MPHDYFITDGSTTSPRWLAAFEGARICRSLKDLPESGGDRVRVWLLAGCCADWQSWMSELSARHFLVIALTRIAATDELQACLLAGARGYVEAYANTQMLQQVAQSVSNGAIWLPATLMAALLGVIDQTLPSADALDAGLTERLTSRERDVVEALRKGMTNKGIARVLGISERTVKEHLGTVFAKFGVTDRLQLVLRLNGRNTVRANIGSPERRE
jgi:two-component system, NarL family, nitrate/nitrite response regulator NarL